ncbi:tachykinin-like peptides receptor 86C [Penaeus japonicus]|uniref:tachykinin-like peptides receptor 86C n=1 Tax=Penaeus japonicus TaxID=27405 RepID=UPI001C715C82|nr:tachykinin-like peptides receptor 86C [Penaeus japonicus]
MINSEESPADNSSRATLYSDLPYNEETEILSIANYSEGYSTFVRCLVSEADRLNLTVDEGFWLPIIYQTFLPQTYNVSTVTEPAANGSVTSNRVQSLTGGPLWDSEDYDLSVDIVRGIVARCFSLTSILSTPRPYLLLWWQQLLWTLVFGGMMTMAVGGNVLVMWIVCAHRRMRTVTNYFLMNLSVADLFMSVLNCMFNFIYMLHSDWPFGAIYCTISNFMANVTIAASVFTLIAISFDRYIAIVKPLEPRMSKTSARVFILVIWASSMLLALPCILYSTTVSITYKDNEVRRGCILRWPDGQTSTSQQEHIYNIVFFITTYLLPMLAMLACYFLIGRELWGSRSIGELTDRQVTSIRSKRRVVKMFIVIVLAFALCWLPQQAFFLYTFHNAQILDTAYIQHIYLACYWLAMSNATVNPLIYYWMNARFRSYFREVVVRCLCLQWPRRRTCSYEGSPEPARRVPACDDHSSRSRSRSDSRQGLNGTMRTTPGSTRYNNHLVVYSSRERLNSRNGWRRVPAPCEVCQLPLRSPVPDEVEGGRDENLIQMMPLTTTRDSHGHMYNNHLNTAC